MWTLTPRPIQQAAHRDRLTRYDTFATLCTVPPGEQEPWIESAEAPGLHVHKHVERARQNTVPDQEPHHGYHHQALLHMRQVQLEHQKAHCTGYNRYLMKFHVDY